MERLRRDMGGSTKRLALGLALISLAFFVPMLNIGTYPTHVLIVILVFSVFAQSWNILAGFAGQASLGHQVFFGIGAYISAILVCYNDVNPWSTLIIGGMISSLFSFFFGFISFRLRGAYFLLTTFSLAQIIRLIILNWPEVTRGALGMVIPLPKSIDVMGVTIDFHSKLPYYYIALIMLLAVFFLTERISKSRFGFKLMVLRENEDAASSIGVNVFRMKLFSLLISAFISGLVGAFYAQYILYIDPSSDPGGVLSPATGFDAVLMCTLGGRGTVIGPLIGAILRYGLGEWIRITFGLVAGLEVVVFGICLILFIIFMPEGVWKGIKKVIHI